MKKHTLRVKCGIGLLQYDLSLDTLIRWDVDTKRSTTWRQVIDVISIIVRLPYEDPSILKHRVSSVVPLLACLPTNPLPN